MMSELDEDVESLSAVRLLRVVAQVSRASYSALSIGTGSAFWRVRNGLVGGPSAANDA